MSRYLMMAALFFGCVATLACQAYNEGYNSAMTRGNEATAIMNLHKIVLAQQDYSVSRRGGYGTFHQLIEDGSLDDRYDSEKPKVNSYVFTMTVTLKAAGAQQNSYSINIDPDGAGKQARHFTLTPRA